MKVKFSVVPFIPVAIAMVVFKIMSIYGLDSNGLFLGMNKMEITYSVIGLALGLFLVCILINIFDRKTAPVYPVKKNPLAGILSILSGLAVASSSVTTLLNTTADSEYYLMNMVCVGFSIFAGIAFIVMSKVHFAGKSVVSGVSMLFIFPALWGCAELVSEFLVATKVSISASDLTSLFCYIFITLYLFSHSMIVSRIKGRNPVKACFIYGLPAVGICLAYGVYVILTAQIEGTGYTQMFVGAEFIILALYALSFLIEMTFNSYTKDEIEIIDGLPSDDDTYENDYIKSAGYNDLVFSQRDDSAEPNVEPSDDYYKSSNGLDDFVIGYNYDEEDTASYLTKNETENALSSPMEFLDSEEKPAEEPVKEEIKPEPQPEIVEAKPKAVAEAEEKPVEKAGVFEDSDESVQDRLSEIDKLLQELESKK